VAGISLIIGLAARLCFRRTAFTELLLFGNRGLLKIAAATICLILAKLSSK